jgi:formylglycine-generating enzyme required for sulfatase activity
LDPQTVSKESVRIQATQGAHNFSVEGNLQVEGTSLKFIPGQPWLYGMAYRVTLLPELKDLQGNRLEARYEWSFETHTLAPGMVPIWPGNFVMGSPSKLPKHEVTLNQIYYILNHEVTVGEYRLCMEAGACRYSEPAESLHWTMKNLDRVDAPINYISWNQAWEYTRWLRHQYPGSYRLCTEAEWEYAIRAKGQGRFGCGEEAGCLNQYAWHSHNLSQPGPQPVQRKQPNTWGLFDMQGNLWEWVQDYYAPLVPETVTQPSGPKEGRLRTVRGGSYRNQPESLELWQRGGSPPEMRHDYVGFRVCASP